MRGIGFAIVLALAVGGGSQTKYESAVIETDVVPQIHSTVHDYRSPPAPACGSGREGRFETVGNRWARSGNICINQVQVSFEAFPDPTLGYTIESDRCRHVGHFSTFRKPTAFFERSVPEQIDLLKTALASDLRAFARRCRIDLDTTPFIDGRFDQFYFDYGDGWWFDRFDDGFRLTPNVSEAKGS